MLDEGRNGPARIAQGGAARDGEFWEILYPVVEQEGKNFAQRFVQISEAQILAVYLWAVLHDRPIC
jgi:hypothetical protein